MKNICFVFRYYTFQIHDWRRNQAIVNHKQLNEHNKQAQVSKLI